MIDIERSSDNPTKDEETIGGNNVLVPVNITDIDTKEVQNNIQNVEEDIENAEENKLNIMDILNNPLIKPLVRDVLESILKKLLKQKLSSLVVAKGTEYVADGIFELTERDEFRKLIRKSAKGKREYKELMDLREKLIKENFKSMLENKLKNSL